MDKIEGSTSYSQFQWWTHKEYVLHCHLLIHAEIYIYMLDTYRRNEQQTQEDFFSKIYTSHFICKGLQRLCGVLLWEKAGDWTLVQYFDPKLMAVNVVSFSFFWCSTGGPEATLLGDGFLYGILSASSPDLNSSGPKGPFGLIWLSLPHLVYNSIQSSTHCLQLHWPWDSTELYNCSMPTQSLKSNV